MDGTFESRLGGAVVGDKSDRSTSTTADGGEEIEGGEGGHDNVVLVVIDVNKAPNLTALNWALTHVIQPGDTVRLLGVLHYIINPMGYKSRADENSWNGASRKVLEHQIATHVAILKSVPAIFTTVEKIGAKLEIDVRANPHSKFLVVEEAKQLRARYVVIDRHIKKDKKFYINNLTCYVTRVKTMTVIEHLRHGVPTCDDGDPEATPTTDTSSEQTSRSASVLTSQEFSVPSIPEGVQAYIGPALPLHYQSQAPPALPSSRSTNLYKNSSPVHESPLPKYGVECSPELLGYSRQQPEMEAVQRWLHSDPGYRTDPGSYHLASEYGYMPTGYSSEAAMHQIPMPLSPFTEAAMVGRMSNLYNSNPYATTTTLPPLYSRNDSITESASLPYPGSYSAGVPRLRESYVRSSCIPASSQSVQTEKEDAIASPFRLQVGNNADNNQLELQGGEDGKSRNSAPISVQARRADATWALDLLNSDLGGLQQMPSLPGNGDEGALNNNNNNSSQTKGSSSPGDDEQAKLERVSSVRRAVSSKKSGPGTPPLCTVCQQKSPVFGKVKRFTYAELQEATNNFNAENYLAKGGYGTVYKGQLKGGQLVAVKQHKLFSSQGDEEFCAEVEVLSCAQHRNLVTLIGYCVERHMRLLVYEYVCNGSLDRHLSPNSESDLQWHHRQKIALGAASALRYLHEECRVGCIVHRDMRPNNILLTHDFTPMVGDFGLARRQSSGDLAEETRVLGTIGYLAPEYAETGQITDKADVYAFGVVLLELISGRKAIEHNRPKKQVSLVEWALPLLASYDEELLDPRLKGQCNEFQLHCMMHAAIQCIKKDPSKRPRMPQVLRILNPIQEIEWAYGPGRPMPENLSNPHTPQSILQLTSPDLGNRYVSSGSSSRSSSCSQSDVSVASHSKPSD